MAALQPGIVFARELEESTRQRALAQAPIPTPSMLPPLPPSPSSSSQLGSSPPSATSPANSEFMLPHAPLAAAARPQATTATLDYAHGDERGEGMIPSKHAVVTPIDSRPFEYPSPSPPPQQPLPNLPSTAKPHTRNISLVSNTSSVRSVKRKPLPLNAKPLAYRESSGASIASSSSFETPGPRFYRAPSIDSPTLWEAGLFKQSDISQGQQRSPPPFQLDHNQQQRNRAVSSYSEQSDISSVYQTEQHPTTAHQPHTRQPSEQSEIYSAYQTQPAPATSQPQHNRQLSEQSGVSSVYQIYQDDSTVNSNQTRPHSVESDVSSVYLIDRNRTPTPATPGKQQQTDKPLPQPQESPVTPDTHNQTVQPDLAPRSPSPSYDHYYVDEQSPGSANTTEAPAVTMPLFSKSAPGNLNLADDPNTQFNPQALQRTGSDKPLPRSPGGDTAKSPGASKLGSFFGWGGQQSPTASSETTFSDDEGANTKSFSPIPSSVPSPSQRTGTRNGVDTRSANEGYFEQPFSSPSLAHLGEMEAELRDISAELATSIRREMELEDLVDSLQAELEAPRNNAGRRTSDYFSDSGGSSATKYNGDDRSAEEVERMVRRVEREKAQMRLECQEKVQEERDRRKGLEKQIRQLEEKASQADLISINSLDATGRLKDLEATCEELQRKLKEEKTAKENFEDLLTALKADLTASFEERDGLKERVKREEERASGEEQRAYQLQMQLGSLREENQMLNIDRENLVRAQEEAEDDDEKEELLAALERDLYEVENERDRLRDEVVPGLEKKVSGLELESGERAKQVEDIRAQLKAATNENASLISSKRAQEELRGLGSLGMDSIHEDSQHSYGSTFTSWGLKRSSSVVGRQSGSGTPMRSRPSSMVFKNAKGEGVVVESREQLVKKVKDVEAQRDALHDALRSLLVRMRVREKEEEQRLRRVEGERDRAFARLLEVTGKREAGDNRLRRVRKGDNRYDGGMASELERLELGQEERGRRMPLRAQEEKVEEENMF